MLPTVGMLRTFIFLCPLYSLLLMSLSWMSFIGISVFKMLITWLKLSYFVLWIQRGSEVKLGSNNNWFVLSFSRVLTVKYISAVHRPLPFSQVKLKVAKWMWFEAYSLITSVSAIVNHETLIKHSFNKLQFLLFTHCLSHL